MQDLIADNDSVAEALKVGYRHIDCALVSRVVHLRCSIMD